jgi:hypothetical protein
MGSIGHDSHSPRSKIDILAHLFEHVEGQGAERVTGLEPFQDREGRETGGRTGE